MSEFLSRYADLLGTDVDSVKDRFKDVGKKDKFERINLPATVAEAAKSLEKSEKERDSWLKEKARLQNLYDENRANRYISVRERLNIEDDLNLQIAKAQKSYLAEDSACREHRANLVKVTRTAELANQKEAERKAAEESIVEQLRSVYKGSTEMFEKNKDKILEEYYNREASNALPSEESLKQKLNAAAKSRVEGYNFNQ